ncbi:sigma factor [Streptomyces formicae]|uniref:RNA polymerase subunit sigma n=1 Tax=Streptomyces formicae TaxID=1616117 RepID=A0ABY3WLL7_9ACTN|nr:sigma factor [Streptomyces formicae]UNM13486.1 RNA polymerase subunit sigma [Streptomyces formicae]
MDRGDDGVSIVELVEERRHLLDVAYWMLGSRSEAEGVVDETYRRWYGLSDRVRAGITVPRSWLARVAGGICLARLTLPWRGEGGGRAGGEGAGGLWEEDVRGVLLGVMDSLTPAERAAFVPNDVFGMAPGAVAGIVGQPEPECVEVADRARRSVRVRRSWPTKPGQHDVVARAVRQACVTEDAVLLVSLLAPDVTAFFDGGGKVRALARPVHGNEQVAHTLLTLLARPPRTTVHTQSVNGRTGLVVRYDGRVAAVISLDTAGPHVIQVWATLNPDKLRTWNQPGTPPGPPGRGTA